MMEYVAGGIAIFVGSVLFYTIIAVHDIPHDIAKKRDHPHQEAIGYAGWISMFTLHAMWPFLWVWATIYNVDRGYGFSGDSPELIALRKELELTNQRLAALEFRVVEAAPETALRPMEE